MPLEVVPLHSPWILPHRLIQFLGKRLDLLQIFAADPTICDEVVLIFDNVFVKTQHCPVQAGVIDRNVATLLLFPKEVRIPPLFELDPLGCHSDQLQTHTVTALRPLCAKRRRVESHPNEQSEKALKRRGFGGGQHIDIRPIYSQLEREQRGRVPTPAICSQPKRSS
jgi:hypothetical protein